MQHVSPENDRRRFRVVFSLFVLLSAGVVLATTAATRPWRYGGSSIFGQTFLVGPTAESLVHGQGLLVCTDAMGTPGNPICYRAARMPVASGTLAAGVLLFGDRPALIILLKNMIFMIPLWTAVGLVLWRARSDTRCMLVCAVLLFLPMLIVNYTGTIVNADAEEGYLFGLPALALAMLLTRSSTSLRWVVGFAVTLDLLYLCKSSMLPAFLVLLCAALLRRSTAAQRVTLVLLACVAPGAWALRQLHVSGRFAVGTSLDGLNFEKGNNLRFQERFSGVGGVLDQYDDELSRGMHFSNEWQFNDYHMKKGRDFVLSHPGYTLRSMSVKFRLLFVTFDRHARAQFGRAGTLAVQAGFVLFRLLQWSSLAVALYAAFTGRLLGRAAGITYVCFTVASLLPYLVGFGYLRHVIIAAYPAVIVLSAACLRLRMPSLTSSAL